MTHSFFHLGNVGGRVCFPCCSIHIPSLGPPTALLLHTHRTSVLQLILQIHLSYNLRVCSHEHSPRLCSPGLEEGSWANASLVYMRLRLTMRLCLLSPWGFLNRYGTWAQEPRRAGGLALGQEQPPEVGSGSAAALGPSTAEFVHLPSRVPLVT